MANGNSNLRPQQCHERVSPRRFLRLTSPHLAQAGNHLTLPPSPLPLRLSHEVLVWCLTSHSPHLTSPLAVSPVSLFPPPKRNANANAKCKRTALPCLALPYRCPGPFVALKVEAHPALHCTALHSTASKTERPQFWWCVLLLLRQPAIGTHSPSPVTASPSELQCGTNMLCVCLSPPNGCPHELDPFSMCDSFRRRIVRPGS